MYENELRSVGLTDGETKVYLALLQLGSSTVGPIVEKSGVAYSNIYEILNRLMEKGLVSFVIKAKTKYFQASPPNQLIDFINKREKQLEENKSKIKEIIPKLEELQKFAGERLEAEVFIGLKGIASAYDVLLKDYNRKEEWVFFYVYDKETVDIADTLYDKLIKKYRYYAKGISNREYKKSWFIRKHKKLINLRIVDFPIPSNIEVYRNNTIIISWSKKPIAFLIHSQDIANKIKGYFHSLWKIAKK